MFSRLETELQSFEDSDLFDETSVFHLPHHHLHKRNANQIFNWFSTDNPSRFNPASGYSEKDISYVFNSHGYRCDELGPSPFLFLGCSYTFGVGLPLQDVWAHKIAGHFKAPYMNVAFHAGSLTYNLRSLMKVWDLVQPKIVIGLFPYAHRLEFISNDKNNSLKVWVKSGIRSQHFSNEDRERLLNYELYTDQKQEEHQLLSHLFSMNSFIRSKGSRFIWSLWEYDEPKSLNFDKKIRNADIFGEYLDSNVLNKHIRWKDLEHKSRDSSHPGKLYHQLFADEVLKYLEGSKNVSP